MQSFFVWKSMLFAHGLHKYESVHREHRKGCEFTHAKMYDILKIGPVRAGSFEFFLKKPVSARTARRALKLRPGPRASPARNISTLEYID